MYDDAKRNSRSGKILGALLAVVALPTLVFLTSAQAQNPVVARPRPFVAHDANGDGFISKEEFESMRQFMQNRGRNMNSAISFEALDTNKDGKISVEEFAAAGFGPRFGGAGRGRGPMMAGGPYMPTFADLDINKDGKVTEPELAEFHKLRIEQMLDNSSPMRRQMDAAIFASMDANKDGVVSKEEFETYGPTRQSTRRGGGWRQNNMMGGRGGSWCGGGFMGDSQLPAPARQ